MEKQKITIQLIECQKLYSDNNEINKETFASLENFILENDTPFLLLKSYKGKKYIQAQNFVGVIQLKNGFTLEILPKITDLEKDVTKSKEILIKMINSLDIIKKPIISWSEIFLLNENFSTYKDKNIALTLLFDMNTLFESYIGQFFKKNCKAYREYEIKLQDKSHFLAIDNNNNNHFPLKLDVVIKVTDENNKIKEHVIFDTKWRHLQQNDKISQPDLYQMYVYGTKYENCKVIYLVYPYTENWLRPREYRLNKNLSLKILFFDLKIDEFIM